MINAIMGLNVIPSQYAREVRTEWKVAPWPIRKRRKGWCVQRINIDRPGVIRSGDTLFIHPDLMPQLMQTAKEPTK